MKTITAPLPQQVRLAPLPVTFVVLTKDEERNLPACLDSLAGIADDVHILDSGSTDATAAIAEERGVPFYVNAFKGFGAQRNWAIDHIPHNYSWTFHLDADERFTMPLAEEIRRVVASDPCEAGFYVPSKLLFRGAWLKRAGGYPAYQVRFFHRGRLRFRDHGHGQREETDGVIGYLREPYLHDAFSKGLDDWFAKHARYARREAEEYLRENSGLARLLVGMFAGDRVRRRRALKAMACRLPARSTIRFWETLVLRRAFLDGRAGIAYTRMLAAYEAMFSAYLEAIRTETRGDANSEMKHAGRSSAVHIERDVTSRYPR